MSTTTYDMLLSLVKTRHSVRKFKPDPIPEDTIEKILEVARWAMSGANSQPWEYIVVKDPQVKKDLFRCYSEDNTDFIYWMEQQRVFELRHPAYQMTADKAVEQQRRGAAVDRRPLPADEDRARARGRDPRVHRPRPRRQKSGH